VTAALISLAIRSRKNRARVGERSTGNAIDGTPIAEYRNDNKTVARANQSSFSVRNPSDFAHQLELTNWNFECRLIDSRQINVDNETVFALGLATGSSQQKSAQVRYAPIATTFRILPK
jgi:hypothetical protein